MELCKDHIEMYSRLGKRQVGSMDPYVCVPSKLQSNFGTWRQSDDLSHRSHGTRHVAEDPGRTAPIHVLCVSRGSIHPPELDSGPACTSQRLGL